MGFAWDQERKIPRDLVGLVPFLQETGNIAFSIALGQGFGSPYWQETGPTAWLTPVYPYMVAGAYRIFGIHTPHAFFAMVLLNILFSAATCIPIFYVGKRVGGLAVASSRCVALGCFPQRMDYSVRMDMGYVAFGAADGDDFVGDVAPGGRRRRAEEGGRES